MPESLEGKHPPTRSWTPDTLFGAWFQRTGIWRRYVLGAALDQLQVLMGPRQRFQRVLDAGCGGGSAFLETIRRFSPDEIVAVDIDPEQIERAAEAAREGIIPVHLRCSDLAETRLADSSFDLVLCHQTLHHITDHHAVVTELFRLLRPGGTLLLSESCRPFLRSLPVRLLFRHPKEALRAADDYLDLLKAVGFEFEEHQVAAPRPFWSEPAFGLLAALGFPSRAQRQPKELLVVAYRPCAGRK